MIKNWWQINTDLKFKLAEDNKLNQNKDNEVNNNKHTVVNLVGWPKMESFPADNCKTNHCMAYYI